MSSNTENMESPQEENEVVAGDVQQTVESMETVEPTTTQNTGSESHSRMLLWGVGAIVILVGIGLSWYFWKPATTSTPGPVATVKVQDQPKKIGIIFFRQGIPSVNGLKDQLKKLGYTNITYVEEEVHVGPTLNDEMDAAVQKMLDEHVDLIWTDHEFQAKEAIDITKKEGNNTPIVFLSRFHDPIEYGLIDSFKSSGNNATGVVGDLAQVTQRTLQFLQEINPNVKKVGIFGKGFGVPDIAGGYFVQFKKQVADYGMEIVEFTTDVPPPEAEAAFNKVAASIKPGDIDALVHIPGHYYETQESGENALAKKLGIPMSAPYDDLPGGGDFSYSPAYESAGVQSAAMVDKIFKGSKPADIPIEFVELNELTLMMGRAAESGIKFSDNMLFIAKEKRP